MSDAPAGMLLTARLELVPFAGADAAELLALFREPHVRRYLLDDRLVDRAWIDREIAASGERFRKGDFGIYTARLREARARVIVGFAGFRAFGAPPHPELLYGLQEKHMRQGLGSEMTRAVIDAAFRDEVDFVEASVDAPNVASVKLLERLGLRRVAQGADLSRWSFEMTHATWVRGR